ncbi:hypothetical protein EDB83DRAFT_193762 [Lactarius deliciosus]|nr:hypothetical protein EDB83DRAFT_193762 [Lactarius deliciosus]
MSSNLFSRKQSQKQRIPGSHPATSDDQPLAHGTTVVYNIGTHGDITMSAIQTSLAALKEGSALATMLPFIAPIAGLLLQALTMRDEVKQYKEECEIVMHKLARIARIIVGVGELCESHNLSEEDLPAGLRAILGSLQRELDRIERVLKKCSKRKGIKGVLLRKDLLTKIKQSDVEISNVLQAFHAELSLDTRVALIAMRREVRGTPILNSMHLADNRNRPPPILAVNQYRPSPRSQVVHRYFGALKVPWVLFGATCGVPGKPCQISCRTSPHHSTRSPSFFLNPRSASCVLHEHDRGFQSCRSSRFETPNLMAEKPGAAIRV